MKTTHHSTFESLESRRLLSVSVNHYGGTVVIEGDSANNTVYVSQEGETIFVNMNGLTGYSRPHFNVNNVWMIEMYGNGGNDLLTISSNIDKPAIIEGGSGQDYLVGGGGYSTLRGHGYEQDVADDNAGDILVAGRGESSMHGDGGNDQLYTDTYASSGTDFMHGDAGSDKFFVRGHDANAWVLGEAGNDSLVIYQTANSNVFYEGGSGTDHVDYRGWNEPVYVRPDGATKSGLLNGVRRHEIATDVEVVYGTDHGDWLSGTNAVNYFYGMGGDDIIIASGGNDYIDAGDGNDNVTGGGGDDFIHGGNGDDILQGSTGNDIISGLAGDDKLYGFDGDDQLYGGTGQDLLYGNNGNDQLYGEGGNDWIYGHAGNDLLVGGSGADFLDASDGVFGNDTVFGDNTNGTGAAGFLDAVYADRWFYNGYFVQDNVIGSESTVWWPF